MTGKVVSWGELQPSGPGLAPSRELNKGQTTLEPRVLPQMDEIGPVQQLTAGREHVVLLGEDGKVWEYRAAGRVANVQDEDGRWGSSEQPRLSASDVISIHAGWVCLASLKVFAGFKPLTHTPRHAGLFYHPDRHERSLHVVETGSERRRRGRSRSGRGRCRF